MQITCVCLSYRPRVWDPVTQESYLGRQKASEVVRNFAIEGVKKELYKTYIFT